jgi:hypothetical protein
VQFNALLRDILFPYHALKGGRLDNPVF